MRKILALVPLLLCSVATAKKDEVDYDIEKDHRYGKHFKATLDEGTWMSVDAHGDNLVFDLLGDLYTLPVAGGEAKRLTEGPAWDQDPRWSPDGSKVLYVSDRGGNQEIWVRDVGAKKGTMVTKGEPARFAEATWLPDGRHIVARKRIVDTRSIGMCELWLFDIEGGDGVQLTKTSEHPFPVNVTAGTSGAFIYFSSTPWRFDYNRDPNGGIFDLYRLNLGSGEVVRMTGEAGGALAPQLSPDGKRIAILRRVAGDTTLETYTLWDGRRKRVGEVVLEHDNQEGFVLNGLYPHYDWLSDKEVVIWDDGTLKRVNMDNGQVATIPWTAKVNLQVASSLRVTHEVADTEVVEANSIRWPTASPDGRKVVFEAFGQLWLQEVGAAKAEPLTDGRVRAFAPAWHPDGDFVAYATWHDEQQGSVRILNVRTKEVKIVTERPFQYLAPSWSPNGDHLAWLRGTGAPARGHTTGNELGYRVEFWNGTRVKDLMGWTPGWMRTERIGWSADGSRLLLVGEEPAEKPHTDSTTALFSYNLEGQDKKVVARWDKALAVSVKPDGKRVAWVEDYRVYSAPLPPRADQTLSFSPDGGPTKVTEEAQDAGQWLSWSGERLSFGLGPEFTLGKEHWTLNASLPRAHALGLVAYTNARVLTMGPEGLLEDATVVVDGERIVSVGVGPAPAGAKVIDLQGKTMMPGIVDVHAHLHYSASDAQPQRSWQHEANLAYGVTTVHDPSANDDTVFGTAERIEAGLQKGPRTYSTGFILYGAWSKGRTEVGSLEDALFHMERKKAVGAVSVKSYQQSARKQRQWILQAARKTGLNVYPEGGGDLFYNLNMLVDGHTDIEHAIPQAPLYADAIGLWATSGASYTPTLLVAYGGISGERYFYQTEDLLNDEKFNHFTPTEWVDRNARRLTFNVRDDDWYYREVAATAGALADAGVRVNLGGHGQVQGLGPHWELWALAEGMGNLGALQAATINGAWTIGMDEDLGSIEQGKLADLLIVDGRPDEDIRDSLKLVEVVKGGVRYDADTLEVLD